MSNDIISAISIQNFLAVELAYKVFNDKAIKQDGYFIDAYSLDSAVTVLFKYGNQDQKGRGNMTGKPALEVVVDPVKMQVIKSSFVR